MNPFNNTQLKSLKSVRLSDSEKGAMLSAIKTEMAKVPLYAEAGVRIDAQERYQSCRTDVNNNFKKKIMPITLLIALIMGGSVSYAAEGALPGDTLYPIMIHVNENVRSALTVTSAGQAELEITLAERRLAEAKQLKAEGRLDMKTKAELRSQVEAHAERAVLEITSDESVDAKSEIGAQADLQIKLDAIGDILEVLEVRVQGEARDEERNSTLESRLKTSGSVVNTTESTTSSQKVQSETQVEASGRTTTQADNSEGTTSASGSVDVSSKQKTTLPLIIPTP